MSEADRKELLEHELLFIQKKFEEACLVDFVIQQIPRVLYDLFNILYYKTKNLELKFRYNCTSLDNYIYLQNYIDYNLYTLKNSSDVKINIPNEGEIGVGSTQKKVDTESNIDGFGNSSLSAASVQSL